jgi:hypothetical protein
MTTSNWRCNIVPSLFILARLRRLAFVFRPPRGGFKSKLTASDDPVAIDNLDARRRR